MITKTLKIKKRIERCPTAKKIHATVHVSPQTPFTIILEDYNEFKQLLEMVAIDDTVRTSPRMPIAYTQGPYETTKGLYEECLIITALAGLSYPTLLLYANKHTDKEIRTIITELKDFGFFVVKGMINND